MQQLLIPEKRAVLLEKKVLEALSKRVGCSIEVRNGNEVIIDGDALAEYDASNVIKAFGRGFGIEDACKLLKEGYYFDSIDMKPFFKNERQIERIKARLIGKEGKAKTYIQSVSGAVIAIYGNTISFVGTLDEITVAKAAISVLIKGGTHSKAYTLMEKARRRSEHG